jgi:hypothetical protein
MPEVILEFIMALGTVFMWVCRIRVSVPTVEEIVPSEGRTYINFDGYDPNLLQQQRSEHWIGD